MPAYDPHITTADAVLAAIVGNPRCAARIHAVSATHSRFVLEAVPSGQNPDVLRHVTGITEVLAEFIGTGVTVIAAMGGSEHVRIWLPQSAEA